MNGDTSITRKSFLSAILGAPALLRASALNGEIGIGHIGTGTRGGDLVRDVRKCTGAKIVAICDVYKPHIEKAVQYSRPRAPQAKMQ